MNCPSRVDPEIPPDWNQNPPALASDATTRKDLNHIANARQKRKSANHASPDGAVEPSHQSPDIDPDPAQRRGIGSARPRVEGSVKADMDVDTVESHTRDAPKASSAPEALATTFNPGYTADGSAGHGGPGRGGSIFTESLLKIKDVLYKYAKFVGPGFMVAVAYIDPGEQAELVDCICDQG